MARRASLTHEALRALGPEKLARLVLDEAERSAPFRKLVAAALAGTKGPGAVAALVDRRLAALERARGFIDRDRCRAFAADLRATLATVVDELGPADPPAAVERLVRLLACAPGVFDRVDDSSGHVQSLFQAAVDALPDLAARMPDEDRARLVERLALAPAAEALEPDHPAAAAVLYRALLDDILARSRASAYGHGARYLDRLAALGPHAVAAAGLIDHDAYRADLREAHGRKAAFWSPADARG